MTELKERIKVWKERDLREIIPLYLARTQKRHAYVCPFHADSGPSLMIYEDHYHCYACHAHGDVIDFAKNFWKIENVFEALEKLGDATIVPLNKVFYHKPRPRNQEALRMWTIAQASIKLPAHRALVNAYLDLRGLTTDFQHGHYRRSTTGGCVVDYVVIPTFFNGKLVSTQLRAMDSETTPKYLRYGQGFGYNEDNALTPALTLPYLVLSAENKAFDVLTVVSYYEAVMGAPAKYLLPAFAKRIVAYGIKQVIIVGDNDKKSHSQQLVMDIASVFKSQGISGKIVFPPDPYKDMNDMGRDGQIESFIRGIVGESKHAK